MPLGECRQVIHELFEPGARNMYSPTKVAAVPLQEHAGAAELHVYGSSKDHHPAQKIVMIRLNVLGIPESCSIISREQSVCKVHRTVATW